MAHFGNEESQGAEGDCLSGQLFQRERSRRMGNHRRPARNRDRGG